MKTAQSWTILIAVAVVALAIGMFATSDQRLFSAHPSELTLGGLPEDTRLVVGSGEIDVDGGTIPLSFSTIGDVDKILVEEDSHVKKGAPLIQLRNELAKFEVDKAEAMVKRAEVLLDQAKRAPVDLDMRVRLQEHSVAASKARLDAQQRQVEKLERLLKINATADENLLSAQEQLRESKIQLDAENVRSDQLRLEDPKEAIEMAEAALESAKAQLDSAREQLARHTLSAPVDGIVLRVLVGPGETLGIHQREPAIWFCPDKPRIVRCEVEQEFATEVSPGMRADIHLENDDSHVWRGVVERCSEWIAPRRYFPDDPTLRTDVRTMECVVQLDENEPPLKLGQQVRVILRPPKIEKAAAPKTESSASSAKG